jgi:CubicO group peptidase (beta-lactamase class C family)
MLRVAITFVFALMLSATAWAGNWNNGGKAKTFGNRDSCIVEGQRAKPTLEQLKASFIYCQQFYFSRNGRLSVAAAKNPRKLSFDVQTDEFVNRQMNTTGMLSYILYKDGKIIKDVKSPQERLGKLFNDETRYQSNSIGKSFTSYLLGHAICDGHISSLDQTIEDWPLLQNTPYEKQRLIDLVNMNVGDSMYFNSQRVLFENQWNIKGVNHETIRYWGDSLRGKTAPKERNFNYSQMVSGLMTNYIAFKMNGHFDDLLRDVYTNKVGIGSKLQVGYVDKYAKLGDGRFSNSVWATRYDYLRIAIAMLEDWRSDTCVGKYLKRLYRSRVNGNFGEKNGHGLFRRHHRYGKHYKYGGFFHTDISDVKGTVFGMAGYGGQYLFINFDSGTIVAINAVHDDFDTAKLVVDAINGN